MISGFLDKPNFGRIKFTQPDGTTLITTAYGWWNPLISTYTGKEVPEQEVKNTVFVLVPFSLRKKISQGDHFFLYGTSEYVIQGLKDNNAATEIVGLLSSAVSTPTNATGLVSEWGFRSFSTLGNDEQGANTLTNVNTVQWSSDKPPQVSAAFGSADFTSSSSEQLNISDAVQSGLDITGSITVALWLKFKTIPDTATLLAKNGTAGNRGYKLHVTTAGKIELILSNDGTAETTAIGATALSTGTWYSIAAVYDGVDIRIYLNGILDSNGASNPKAYTLGIFNNNQNFALGSFSGGGNYLNGYLSHVFIFNVAKSAAQVSTWHSNDTWT